MDGEVIIYTQIASLLAYVGTVFFLYRLLVKQKDATIGLLKERIDFLSEQLALATANSPDALSERLANRIQILSNELGRLDQDQETNRALIQQKEEQLNELQTQAQDLQERVERAKELLADASCPNCGALISERHFYPIHGYVGGREVEAEGEYILYECGYAVQDGQILHNCQN